MSGRLVTSSSHSMWQTSLRGCSTCILYSTTRGYLTAPMTRESSAAFFRPAIALRGAGTKLIVINAVPGYQGFSHSHTIAHEGGGHYILHFLQGVGPEAASRPVFCRDVGNNLAKKHPLEWQADRFAGELVMPLERVKWLLDGKEAGELINLELYARNFQEYFETSRAQMEKRLVDLGYLLTHAKYEWADYSKRR